MVLKEKTSVTTATPTESAYHKNHFLQGRQACKHKLLERIYQRAHQGSVLATVDQLLHHKHIAAHKEQNAQQTQEEGDTPVVSEQGSLLVPVPMHVQNRVAPPVPRLQSSLLPHSYLGDRSDSVGQAVERLAAVLQPEHTELIHRTLDVVQSRGGATARRRVHVVVVVTDRETLHLRHVFLLEWVIGVEQGGFLETLEVGH